LIHRTDDADTAGGAGRTSDHEPAAGRGRLVYITSLFPVLRETFIAREVIELEKLGLDVLVVSLKNRPQSVGREELPRAEIIYLPFFFSFRLWIDAGRTLLAHPVRLFRELVRLAWALKSRPRRVIKFLSIVPKSLCLAAMFKKLGVRHLHAQFATVPTTCAYLISRLSDLPFSFTAHAWDIYARGSDLFLKEKMAAAERVITISNYNREYLIGLGGPASRIWTVYQGLEMDRYDYVEKKADGPPLIAVGGALEPKKGVHLTLEALASLKARGGRFRIEIFGNGPDRQRLAELVCSLGLSDEASFLGGLPHREVIRLFQRADIFILAAIRAPNGSMDGLPNVVAEAMACGAAVVASRLSGIPELIRDRTDGILFPPGDIPLLAEAVGELLDKPTLRIELARQARRRVETFFDLKYNITPLAEYFRTSLRRPERGASPPQPETPSKPGTL
jgi:colanic acid/amylovoran biosynthesis glycosyltransferase